MDKSKRESIGNIIFVAVAVCLVCSVVVSATAVTLKPMQQRNAELDRKQNVLRAAGQLPEGRVTADTIEELFAQFDARGVDLRTGEFTDEIDPETFDPQRSTREPGMSRDLPRRDDPAGLGRIENYSVVFTLDDEAGDLELVVLPVRGGGLWGMMSGYLALDSDMTTIRGLTFYDHQETPGLGGEVDNPRWRAQWPGVQAFDETTDPAVRLVKRRSPETTPAARHEVDAIAGATLTNRGVEQLINFWLSDRGFGPLLERLEAEAQ